MSLNREQILAAKDVTIQKVAVPEWSGDVYVKSLQAFQRETLKGLDQRTMFTKLLILSMVDENGVSLGFTDEDIVALEEKSLSATARVFQAAIMLNGMSKEAVEGAAKN